MVYLIKDLDIYYLELKNDFSDESRIARQNKMRAGYSRNTFGGIFGFEYSPKMLQNTEDIGGVRYIIQERYKFKIPKLLNAARRREIVDRLSTFV